MGKYVRKGSAKVILMVVVPVLVVLIALGGYFAYQGNLKKVANAYVDSAAGGFSNAVVKINDLSTEKRMGQENEDSQDVYVNKMSEEKKKTEKALEAVTAAKNLVSGLKSNKLVASLPDPFHNFLESAEEKVGEYDKYIGYLFNVNDLEAKYMKNAKEILNDDASTEEGAKNLLKKLQKITNDLPASIKSLEVPGGLSDSKQLRYKYHNDYSQIFNEFMTAVENKDFQKTDSLSLQIQSYRTSGEGLELLKGMIEKERSYFDGLHNKFADLRKSADSVKSNFIETSTKLNKKLSEINVEGW